MPEDDQVISQNIEAFKLKSITQLSRQFIEDAEVDISALQRFTQDFVVSSITQKVWGQRLGDTIEVEYPADWWQAFKERWFPNWAKERWPVKQARTVIDVVELYPKWLPPDTEAVKLARILNRGSAKIRGIDDPN